jgi:pyruvate/2-oxoglutarate dehydrogenase complex dihydrolipoamide dehydrogenase (E3) component
VVATGSRPLLPPIPGLERVPALTNETVFDLQQVPSHLVVIGGGPIGIELGQAFRALGALVTVVEQATILSREDPDLVAVVRARLAEQGVVVHEGAVVAGVAPAPGGIRVEVTRAGAVSRLEVSHLLVAAGRAPVLDGLELAAAGIACTSRGITVDRRLRTSNRRVFAVGDVAGGPQFTHVAGYQAGIVLRNALFRLPAAIDYGAVPRVTYTHPELAQVGRTEAEVRGEGGECRVLRAPFGENDRARAERTTEGLVKVVVDRRGRILGAGIAGAQAGELIQVWVLAMQQRLRVGALAGMIAPYPTLGEANKRAAGQFYAEKLFSPRVRRLVRALARLG